MQTEFAQVSTRSEQDLLPGVRLPLVTLTILHKNNKIVFKKKKDAICLGTTWYQPGSQVYLGTLRQSCVQLGAEAQGGL